MLSDAEILAAIRPLVDRYDGALTENRDVYVVELRHATRALRIDWARHGLPEVWLTFLDADREVHRDWVECAEADERAEFAAYVQAVAARFLDHASRAVRTGRFLKTKVLEYRDGDVWRNVFE